MVLIFLTAVILIGCSRTARVLTSILEPTKEEVPSTPIIESQPQPEEGAEQGIIRTAPENFVITPGMLSPEGNYISDNTIERGTSPLVFFRMARVTDYFSEQGTIDQTGFRTMETCRYIRQTEIDGAPLRIGCLALQFTTTEGATKAYLGWVRVITSLVGNRTITYITDEEGQKNAQLAKIEASASENEASTTGYIYQYQYRNYVISIMVLDYSDKPGNVTIEFAPELGDQILEILKGQQLYDGFE